MIIFREGQPFNTDYQDVYSSADGALEQAWHVFVCGNNLPERFSSHRGLTVIGELGFGFGINFLVTARTFLEQAHPNDRLFYASCDLHPPDLAQLKQYHARLPLPEKLVTELHSQWISTMGFHQLFFAAGKIILLLMVGEAAEVWQEFTGTVNAWYLDGFAPKKNPAMWQAELFETLKFYSAPDATFATYSVAAEVRKALNKAGWQFEKVTGYGRKKEMLRGVVCGYRMLTSEKPQHVRVVGAGLAGSALAAALGHRGIKVTLYDRQREPTGASGNPAGILMPMVAKKQDTLARLCAQGFNYTTRLLRQEHDIFYHTGIKYLPPKGKSLPAAEELPFSAEIHPPDNYCYRQTLWIPGGGAVRLARFCHWLREQAGTNLEFCVTNIQNWQELAYSPAEPLILANGAEMRLWDGLEWLPLKRLYGQISWFSKVNLQQIPDFILCSDNYLIPMANEIIVGATFDFQEVPYSCEQARELVHNLTSDFNLKPNWSQLQLNQGRVSFRSVTYDRYPLVGQLPDREKFQHLPNKYLSRKTRPPAEFYTPGVYLLTGFGSRGLSLAPLAAEVLAASLCGEPLPIEKSLWQRMEPARFLLRNQRRHEKHRINF